MRKEGAEVRWCRVEDTSAIVSWCALSSHQLSREGSWAGRLPNMKEDRERERPTHTMNGFL